MCMCMCVPVRFTETRHDNMPSMWEGARGSVFDCLSRKAAWAAFVSEVI